MIHVKRPRAVPEVDAALRKPVARRGREQTELEWARAYYAKKRRPKRAYDFVRYKEFAVVRALNELFHHKCAYCETYVTAGGSCDVEHFRPKGGVSESPRHPGYWWLAAEWTNLLPSCQACNQLRKQVAYAPGMTAEEFEAARLRAPKESTGKANSFPTRNDRWIDDETGDLSDEDPLLINPCERHPERHVEWVFDRPATEPIWSASTVMAFLRPRRRGRTDDPYGAVSIAVYGLRRSELFRLRNLQITTMQVAARHVVDAIKDYRATRSAARKKELARRIASYRADLLAHTEARLPYAGMARAFVAEFERDLARYF